MPEPDCHVSVTEQALSDLLCDCRSRYPEEACGLLGGVYCPGIRAWRIESAVPLANAHSSPQTAFAFDPREWINAYYGMPKNRQQFAGIYHSHPHTPAVPSLSDEFGFVHSSELNYWIVSFPHAHTGRNGNGLAPQVQPYRYSKEGFRALPLVIA